jgi:macrodomain Ter protein organizer (MatP/YcbG family)
MLTDAQKISIYKWRDANPDRYKDYEKNYYRTYRLNNREKELERCRRYRAFTAESQRLRKICLDI